MSVPLLRKSNIELLRIFSMLYIIFYHILIHSIAPTYKDFDFLLKPITATLHVGVICFILISGYFGVKLTVGGLIKLIVPCLFYSSIFLIIDLLWGNLSFSHILTSSSPFQWWYVNVYFCLLLLTPIINIPLKTSSELQILFFTTLLGVVACLSSYFVPALTDGKNPINFIFIYYVGYTLRTSLATQIKKLTLRSIILLYVGFNIIVALLLLMTFNGFGRIRDLLFYKLVFPYSSIGLIINAVLFFIIFTKINISKKWINTIAASTFGVYLLHENGLTGRYIYPLIGSFTAKLHAFYQVLFLGLGATLMLFLFCFLIDKTFSMFYKKLEQLITKSTIIVRFEDKLRRILQNKATL